MNINVTVDEVALDTVIHSGYDGEGRTIGDEVARLAVNRLTEDRGQWDTISRRVCEIRDEEIRAAVVPLIREALTEPVQNYVYGEPVGKPTTLRSLIVDEARKLLKMSTDNYSNRSGTVIGKLIADEVKKAIAGEISEQVKEARAKVAGEIGNQVAAIVADGMRKR